MKKVGRGTEYVEVPGLGTVLLYQKEYGGEWLIKAPDGEVLGGPYKTQGDAKADMYRWASKGY